MKYTKRMIGAWLQTRRAYLDLIETGNVRGWKDYGTRRGCRLCSAALCGSYDCGGCLLQVSYDKIADCNRVQVTGGTLGRLVAAIDFDTELIVATAIDRLIVLDNLVASNGIDPETGEVFA